MRKIIHIHKYAINNRAMVFAVWLIYTHQKKTVQAGREEPQYKRKTPDVEITQSGICH